ncbi:helix-turn-helix domain-containing protein [Melissococcus plutonius]|uniref:Transcriptional regulator, Cro/CI family n=1 Tax=Melissococcus plutonius (strain ATCC 35311 / DSM 29964 / CIP 104052 / LMG 20360 / NCIMB 702443) TaxID=940190 RepID=F3YAA0_MELPT|nr:helix-turn-helix transcriptional regulator [Melissococcus plutonius]AIM24917.1 transcriptional regulator, Cro/CI family [Melissococcus plutonius S1]KMT25058.1 transcriptional regulator, Cro/CI family [Melissococcus plutonius]KMT26695.1 transcriptional regulator, Cro/CI family [Melissococcus plutonius]KMT27945.1 transcriptional regulator, Cro/CI family [Melissococcus plutonius]KMT29718.1 transcriptional regulator, Cro/CI family [Melissococcus plutonius]
MDSFGSIIKKIRKQQHLTQKMLSEDICSQGVLSRIENGEELPNIMVMQRLCQRLGVTMDQIMSSKSLDFYLVPQVFEQIAIFFRHKCYQQLINYMEESELVHYIYLDTDWQWYYYYLGNCEYFLTNNYVQAIDYLKKSLSYTYHVHKIHVSDAELQVISCLGNIYSHSGNQELAKHYFDLSIQYFNKWPNERIDTDLTLIFYHYATFLVRNNQDYEQANRYIDQGIDWALKKSSYYFLGELLLLKSKVMQEFQLEEQTHYYQTLAEQICHMETLMSQPL